MHIPPFKDPNLLRHAFIHRSFLNEHRSEKQSNERLEFLGDSILSFVVSRYLFELFPDHPEGILTNLRSNIVNTRSLATVANDLKLGEKLLLSKGEEEGGGRTNTSLLADTYEALIGALFMDQGLAATDDFIHRSLLSQIQILTENLKDPKSLLQEIIQAQGLASPVYKVVSEVGPDHAKLFTVEVEVSNKPTASGTGKSKRLAETAAAQAALAKVGEK